MQTAPSKYSNQTMRKLGAHTRRYGFYFAAHLMTTVYKSVPDKTNKMAGAPSEHSDQPGHQPSMIRVFAVRMKKLGSLAIRRMPRLTWVFAGRTSILLILSCVGSYVSARCWQLRSAEHLLMITDFTIRCWRFSSGTQMLLTIRFIACCWRLRSDEQYLMITYSSHTIDTYGLSNSCWWWLFLLHNVWWVCSIEQMAQAVGNSDLSNSC